MNTEFKIRDSVQLLDGITPTMIITKIDADSQQAFCTWYDNFKTKQIKEAWILLTALKHAPKKERISKDTLVKTVYRL